jgi:hypothetical protein
LRLVIDQQQCAVIGRKQVVFRIRHGDALQGVAGSATPLTLFVRGATVRGVQKVSAMVLAPTLNSSPANE